MGTKQNYFGYTCLLLIGALSLGAEMVTTSPYHTEYPTAYPELEDSRSALLIPEEVTSVQVQEERITATKDPAEVWAAPSKEALPTRIARGFLAFYDWLSGPGMTDQDRVIWRISPRHGPSGTDVWNTPNCRRNV